MGKPQQVTVRTVRELLLGPSMKGDDRRVPQNADGSVDKPRGRRWRSIGFGALRLGIGVALLALLANTGVLDFRELGGLFREWPFTLLAILVTAIAVSATAWRLCILLRPRGFALSLGASLKLTFIGTFFNIAMPGSSGGDLVRIYYAARGNEGRRAEIVAILLMDRSIGLVALLLYPVLLAPLYLPLLADNELLRNVVLTAGGSVGMLALAAWLLLARETGKPLIAKLLARIPGGSIIRRMAGTLRSYRSDRRPLWRALFVSLGAHALGMTAFVLLARAVVSPTFEWFLFVIVPVGMVVNTIPLTPGGLGVGEAAFAVLFGMAGLQGGPEVLLSWRLVSILIGMAGLVFYLQGRSQFVTAAARSAQDPEAEPRAAESDAALSLEPDSLSDVPRGASAASTSP